ncbi:Mannan endo-1,4-beta-mannosidase [Fibrella aestuarina BUZ 2]|uniref:Mannan endo-1,4-beta-mannosidase n=1 Tax=Fibrella aestuarina BUZ 2 TaxID=1166018 RepID=I0KDY3_9BACT|nr:glycosyl hydrolase [Fibrella aestuarina]CCH02336.1 Mannan endo-1,4-beta-mannosidase [Fibrella aestuarina BUZ 2]
MNDSTLFNYRHLFAILLVVSQLAIATRTLGADPIRIEAESGTLAGVEIATVATGFSGKGYVTGFDNATDQLSLSATVPAGLYELTIGYRSASGDKGIDFQVNGSPASGTLKQTAGFRPFSGGKFLLTGGNTIITIFRGWGYFDIDYVLLTPATVKRPTKPTSQLSDAAATPSTLGLYAFLVDQYGQKVIAGQQDDVEYVLDKTGKEPAIGAFDLIDYSPTRVQNGAKPLRSSEACIDWAKKGNGRGIVSLMWHWNAPTDLINQAPDKLWWRGFYTDATTFDLNVALADKTSQRYQLLLRDIDAIATELKKFQTADVPVLWRPLHEAPGGWFWWGAKGPAPFRQLWQLLYDRLTNYHNLHNLIWVYTATDTVNPDWYPGDAYVDVVGLDIYSTPNATLSTNWDNALAQFDGKKLVTLSESGNPPTLDAIRGLATWWSWFAVWTGTDYIKKQPVEQLRALFTDADVITRDELPDWRKAITPLITGVDPDPGYHVTAMGNPIDGSQVDLDIEGAEGQALRFVVFDTRGRQLTERAVTPRTATLRYSFPLGSHEPGLYLIRIFSATKASTLKLIKS